MTQKKQEEEKNKVGRPRIIESPERMDELVEEYRAECKAAEEPLTLTGLIRHVGLSSRESFDEYGRRSEFSDSVKSAKLLIECEYEKRLHGPNAAGGIFGLKNFGWKDSQQHELTGKDGGPMQTQQVAPDYAGILDEVGKEEG